MWERVGALEGGTVGGLAVVPDGSGNGRLLAVTPAGLFAAPAAFGDQSRRLAWSPLSAEGGPPLADAVAVSPDVARDGTLFVASRTGLYRSTDGGAHWDLVLVGEVLGVALSPEFAADGTLFVGSGQDGVIRSEDRGASWDGANAGLLDLTILAVALSPRFGADRTAFVGTASGLYRTRNGGRAWREVNLGLADPSVQVLAISPGFADDRLVLAGTEAHGLLRSTDGGARFEVVADLAERGISALTIGPDGRTVAVAAGAEVLRSDDGGRSWQRVADAPGLVLSLAHLPAPSGAALVAGLHRGGVARLDASGTWHLENDGLRAGLLTRLVPSPRFGADGTMLALSLDEGLLVSRDGGSRWERGWPEDAEPAIATLAVSPAPPSGWVALASTAERQYRSDDGGVGWHALSTEGAPPLAAVAAVPAGGSHPSFVGVVPAGGESGTWQPGQVVLSEDGGDSWRAVGQIVPEVAGRRLEIGAVAAPPDFQRDRTLFASGVETRADGGASFRLWRSTDGGRSWHVWLDVADAAGPPLATTLLVPSGYARDGTVVVAVGGRVFTPVAGSWERRGGQRRPVWRAAEIGPAVASVTALAAPPDGHGDVVYASTNAGPFVSRDGGRTFRVWAEGYDGGGMVSLAVSPSFADDRLVLGVGVGGTVWRRRDDGRGSP